jgi:hypothetical protein
MPDSPQVFVSHPPDSNHTERSGQHSVLRGEDPASYLRPFTLQLYCCGDLAATGVDAYHNLRTRGILVRGDRYTPLARLTLYGVRCVPEELAPLIEVAPTVSILR